MVVNIRVPLSNTSQVLTASTFWLLTNAPLAQVTVQRRPGLQDLDPAGLAHAAASVMTMGRRSLL